MLELLTKVQIVELLILVSTFVVPCTSTRAGRSMLEGLCQLNIRNGSALNLLGEATREIEVA